MKCTSCGAEIGILDKVCPYCGNKNEGADGRQADIDKYENQSLKTRERIKKYISENIPIVISSIIGFLLLVSIFAADIIGEQVSESVRSSKYKKAIENYDENMKEISRYLEDGDYIGCLAFAKYHDISDDMEPYDELYDLMDMADYYKNAVNSVEELTIHGADAQWYRPETDISIHSFSIENFYKEYERKLPEIEDYKYLEYIYDMKDRMDIFMRIYLGLDDDGLAEYLAGSPSRQQAYLEEVLLND